MGNLEDKSAKLVPNGVWNRTKVVSTEMAAINNGTTRNMQCQSLQINTDRFRIDTVACMLSRRYGIVRGPASSSSSLYEDYSVVMDLYEADTDGKPVTFLKRVSKPASGISTTTAAWAYFDFSIPTDPDEDLPTPESRTICFVIYQDGGSDDDYVATLYTPTSDQNSLMRAYISSDGGASWEEQENAIRIIQLLKDGDLFENAYDSSESSDISDDFQIGTPPGTPATIVGDPQNVTISHSPMIVSFVVDSSGSMGWSDRTGRRVDMINRVHRQIAENYPAEVLFDMVSFGGSKLEVPTISTTQKALSIKIDLSSPDSTTLNNDGTTPSKSDQLAAWGFSDLEEGHEYTISTISTDTQTIDDNEGVIDISLGVRKPVNKQSVGSSSRPILFSVTTDGPNNAYATNIAVPTTDPLTATDTRAPFSFSDVSISKLTTAVNSGDTSVDVENTGSISQGNEVRIIDKDGISDKLLVDTNPTATTISFADPVEDSFGIGTDGGFLQAEAVTKTIDLSSETTAEILLKDPTVSRSITFYLQTDKGGTLRWSIRSFSDWEYESVYFRGDTASLYIDSSSIPNNTRIDFYVDEMPPSESTKTIIKQLLYPAEPGDSLLYFADIADIKEGQRVVLISEDKTETSEGYTVFDIDAQENAVEIFPASQATFDAYYAEFFATPGFDTSGSLRTKLPIDAINITPMVAGKLLPDYLLQPQDPPQTPVLPATPDIYNQSSRYFMRDTIEVPTINGIAAIRVLPITADTLASIASKESEYQSLSYVGLSDEENQQLQAEEEAYRKKVAEFTGVSPSPIDTTPALVAADPTTINEGDLNYSIVSPVFSTDGRAESEFKTYARNFTIDTEHPHSSFRFNPSSLSETGERLQKLHTIYAVASFEDALFRKTSVKLAEFPLAFLSPVHIMSSIESTIDYVCPCTGTPATLSLPGKYASSEDPIEIEYVVYDKYSFMKNGSLKVRIFDETRNKGEIADPTSVFPDIETSFCESSCGETAESETFVTSEQKVISNTIDEETGQYSMFLDRNSGKTVFGEEASYFTDYDSTQGIEVPIVDGKATLSINCPAGIVASLKIVAEVQMPDPSLSVVRIDKVHIANPLSIVFPDQGERASGTSEQPVELSATVYFEGSPVQDNTAVNFASSLHSKYSSRSEGASLYQDSVDATVSDIDKSSLPDSVKDAIGDLVGNTSGSWPPTRITPSVGKTSSGIASGVFLGPHGMVVNHLEKTEDGEVEERGDTEQIIASTSYQGYSATKSSLVEWMGQSSSSVGFYFPTRWWKNGTDLGGSVSNAYADGWDYYYLVADIPLGVNLGFQYLESLTPSMTGKDENGNWVGVGDRYGNPSGVHFANIAYAKWETARPVEKETGLALGHNHGNIKGWASTRISRATFLPTPKISIPCNDPFYCCQPFCIKYPATTQALIGAFGYSYGMGCGEDVESYCFKGGIDDKTYAHAKISWIEPLSLDVFMATENGASRGSSAIPIWADVSFSGKPIPQIEREHNILSEDGEFRHAPTVGFSVYYIKETKNISGVVIKKEKVYDASMFFDNAIATVSSFITSEDEAHFHECTIDDDGNGTTTKTYDTNFVEITNHTHNITSFTTDSYNSDSITLHTHSLRSVAKTSLSQLLNIPHTIVIEATIQYDASSPEVDRTLVKEFTFPYEPSVSTPNLKVDLQTDDFETRETTGVSESGYTVKALVTHAPAGSSSFQNVPDGTRVFFSFTPYTPNTDNEKILTLGESTTYALLDVSVKTEYDGVEASDSLLKAPVNTEFFWIQNAASLVTKISSTQVYFSEALQSISSFGSSPISDAVKKAADRIISYHTTNPEWKDRKKAIFLFTDGDENSGRYTYESAVAAVNRVNGNEATPIIVYQFGAALPSDKKLLDKLASNTDGTLARIYFDESTYIENVIDDTITNHFPTNIGTYSSYFDLYSPKLYTDVDIEIEVPTDAEAQIRFGFGDSLDDISGWTSYQTITGATTISLSTIATESTIKRYLRYEIIMKGNANFDSPNLSLISAKYVEPSTNYIVFAPIVTNLTTEEFVSQILITDKANNDSNSVISYAATHAEELDIDQMFSNTEDAKFSKDKQHVILSRENEPLERVNSKTYRFANGSWSKHCEVSIYNVVGTTSTLVDPASYTANPSNGTVVFESTYPEGTTFVGTVVFGDKFKIVCKVVNFGETGASFDHIGISYCKSNRYTLDSDGNIVRRSISDRLDESSSSSESTDAISSSSSSDTSASS